MKRVLITGGSRGIGAACVRKFCAAGDAVAFVYCTHREDAEALTGETGAVAIRADLGDRNALAEAAKTATDLLGGVDVLINNAGISEIGLFTDMTDEEWDRMCAVNLSAPMLLTRALLPGMLKRHSGRIVNIGSVWGRVGASCEVVYSAVKAGLRGFTLALAKEVGPSGITVNCVEPGVIATDMNRCHGEETLRALAEDTPLCRIGTPEDVAETVYFLASDAAAFVTGQILGVDGGFGI